jgi:Tfp pilus assembly protein PilF
MALDLFRAYQQSLQQNDLPQAIRLLQQHLSTNRNYATGFYQLGNMHRRLEQWPQALCAYLEACRLDPSQSDFFLNLGVTYQSLQQTEQAIVAYSRAYEKNSNPATLFNRSQALLLAGRYEEGWRDYESRIQMPQHQAIFGWHRPERRWQGQPFPGQTLIVYHEQGLGDDFQFCRYLPYVKALGGKVILSTRPPLIPILSTLDGVDQVIDHSEEAFRSLRFQWAVPLMSLPHLCGTTLDSIPSQTPYLSVPESYRLKWDRLLASRLSRPGVRNIGLVFSCNPTSDSGTLRSCPLPLWSSLFELPGIQWFSLQKGDAAAAVKECAATRPNLIDLTAQIEDFADTAALLDRLDLLIAVDTSVPHLDGALGKPVWMLLPFANEWRWLLRRSDSPWYPSFRLFRQPGPGQWAPMLARVRQALLTADKPFTN